MTDTHPVSCPFDPTRSGHCWVGIYQWLGIVGLCAMVATVADAPILGLLPPLLVGSGFLGLFALASGIRLWRARGEILSVLTGGGPEALE